MPKLSNIIIQNFRNIHFSNLSFSNNVNCISGNNGMGKTNLLDSIFYLSMTKSAFIRSDKHLICHNYDSFSLMGDYNLENGLESKISIQVNEKGEKKIKKDNKAYSKIAEHLGMIPIVMVSPLDINLICEEAEQRRRFLNMVLSQIDIDYIYNVQQYNKLLNQRNKILKDNNIDLSLLDIFDLQLSNLAQKVYKVRDRFINDISPIVQKIYRELSSGQEEINITYKSDLQQDDLYNILIKNRQRDKILGHTSCGVHRDDIIFTMNDELIRRYGSQGQQKSFLVAIKFAQYELMKSKYNFPPILLLDDVFDKLDMNRIGSLLQLVASNDFGQIFITDCNKVRLTSIINDITKDRAYFEAKDGDFYKQD